MLEDIEDGDVGHRALDDDSVAEDETADQAVEALPTAHEPMRRMMRNRQRDDRADRAETARDDEGDPAQDRKIGRAHVRTPVTNAHLVCRLLLEKKTDLTQLATFAYDYHIS